MGMVEIYIQTNGRLDLFYCDDLIVAFNDETDSSYVTAQHAEGMFLQQKAVIYRHLKGRLVPAEQFDVLLMGALRRNKIDEIGLRMHFHRTNVTSYDLMGHIFEKDIMDRIWKDEKDLSVDPLSANIENPTSL